MKDQKEASVKTPAKPPERREVRVVSGPTKRVITAEEMRKTSPWGGGKK